MRQAGRELCGVQIEIDAIWVGDATRGKLYRIVEIENDLRPVGVAVVRILRTRGTAPDLAGSPPLMDLWRFFGAGSAVAASGVEGPALFAARGSPGSVFLSSASSARASCASLLLGERGYFFRKS